METGQSCAGEYVVCAIRLKVGHRRSKNESGRETGISGPMKLKAATQPRETYTARSVAMSRLIYCLRLFFFNLTLPYRARWQNDLPSQLHRETVKRYQQVFRALLLI